MLFTYLTGGGDYTPFWFGMSHTTWGNRLAHKRTVDFCFITSEANQIGSTDEAGRHACPHQFVELQQGPMGCVAPVLNEQAALLFISSM